MDDKFYIGGKHAVLCALNNPKREVHQIFLSKKDNNFNFSKTKIVNKNFFSKIFEKSIINHQYVAALVSPLENSNLKDSLKTKNIKKIVILNGISDQRNIGSIMRTVLAFDFDGIILEKKFFNQKNPLMIKAASGAIEYLSFFSVANIKNEIKLLQKEGFYIVALDSNSEKKISNKINQEKIAFVFGSENLGIKKLVKKYCNDIVKIPINKKIESLNVSNAVSATLAIMKLQE